MRPNYVTPLPPQQNVYVGDCRKVMARLTLGGYHLIFADPPFNQGEEYGTWDDKMTTTAYLDFTQEWLTLARNLLTPQGSLWVNIPDQWAAEVVMILKGLGLHLINWCIWHYRFGQHRAGNFIVSKAHALYFARDRHERTWNPEAILEPSDRASVYNDPRTQTKKTGTAGMRVPLDVWYGPHWGRVQGNNRERRPLHQNQLPEVYLERIIRACSNPGQLVLDPFLGSGTTLVAARALGRLGVGIEVDPALAASAWERIIGRPVRDYSTDRK